MENRLNSKHLYALVALLIGSPTSWIWAHCDSMDGPVVKDARAALAKGNPTPVLKWVAREHEDEIRKAFQQAVAVRAKGDDAKELADRFFFETLVRIHRAGEGEAFTGLKPSDSVDPGIAAADKALQSGSADELAKHLSNSVSEGIKRRFQLAAQRKKGADAGVEAGREFVEAYVDYVHFVESVNRITSHGASHKHHEPAPESSD